MDIAKPKHVSLFSPCATSSGDLLKTSIVYAMLRLVPSRCAVLSIPRAARCFSAGRRPFPLIDFSAFLHGTPSQRERVGREVVGAFKSVGFVYLSRTGLGEGASRRKLFASVRPTVYHTYFLWSFGSNRSRLHSKLTVTSHDTQADRFFSLPAHIKASLAWKDPRSNRGCVKSEIYVKRQISL